MRTRVQTALLAALLISSLLPAAHAADAVQDPPSAGRALFQLHCGKCHLQGGTGTFMLGRRLGEERALLESRTDLTADYIRYVVRHGIQSMPRFARPELPDADLQRIADYLPTASRIHTARLSPGASSRQPP